jgi:Zn-dependent protease with chaperone function
MNKTFKIRGFMSGVSEPKEVVLSVVFNGLLIQTNEESLLWKYESLSFEKGGSNHQLYIVKNKNDLRWVFYIREKEAIKEITKFYSGVSVTEPLQSFKLSLFWVLPLFFLIGALGSFYFYRGEISQSLTKIIPTNLEEKLGAVVLNQVLGVEDVQKFSEPNKKLQSLVEQLKSKNEFKNLDLQVFIKEDSNINAFALPGGKIVFNTGLILEAETPEEILGVAAHEISHVVLRHSIKQLISTMGTYVFVQFFLGDFTGLIAILADNSAFLLTRMYSREAEEEADNMGLQILLNSKIDPNGLLTFFEKLKKSEKKRIEIVKVFDKSKDVSSKKQENSAEPSEVLSKTKSDESSNENMIKKSKEIEEKLNEINQRVSKINFLSTHPDIDNRIETLRSKIIKIDTSKIKYKTIDFDLQSLKNEITISGNNSKSLPNQNRKKNGSH